MGGKQDRCVGGLFECKHSEGPSKIDIYDYSVLGQRRQSTRKPESSFP